MEFIAPRGESWRLDRLAKAAGVFCTIVGITSQQLDLLVASLQDHKGELHIRWTETPSERFMAAFRDAWRLCGESSTTNFAPDLHGVSRAIQGPAA